MRLNTSLSEAPASKSQILPTRRAGVDRAAAIVRTPDGEAITLFNPSIIEQAGEVDEQYEGCLSFFDVRGQVPRAHVIHVDHLHGTLYTDRMREGVKPIPVEQYRGTGTTWKY